MLPHYSIFHFFFSSRRRHTRCGRDWSSDVCSSDLVGTPEYHPGPPHPGHPPGCSALLPPHPHLELGGHLAAAERVHRAEELGRAPARSEERRVGKVCGSRWSMIERENKIYIYQ